MKRDIYRLTLAWPVLPRHLRAHLGGLLVLPLKCSVHPSLPLRLFEVVPAEYRCAGCCPPWPKLGMCSSSFPASVWVELDVFSYPVGGITASHSSISVVTP